LEKNLRSFLLIYGKKRNQNPQENLPKTMISSLDFRQRFDAKKNVGFEESFGSKKFM